VLRVFGTEQGLRYRIPFREVDEVIDYLREHATEDGERVGMMGDDGEKFGAWPGTYELCWSNERWGDHFFEALEQNEDWLATVTPADPAVHAAEAERRRMAFGYILIAVGVAFLLSNAGVFRFVQWQFLWPLVLIGIGVLFLVQRVRS